MADKYKPEELKEDALQKKLILDTAVDTQVILQLLIKKNIITKEELDEMRVKVKGLEKYRLAYEMINNIEKAANLYENDPQAYLKALFADKMNGGR